MGSTFALGVGMLRAKVIGGRLSRTLDFGGWFEPFIIRRPALSQCPPCFLAAERSAERLLRDVG